MTLIRIDEGERWSQAVIHGDTVYLAGQVGNPDETVQAQTLDILARIDDLLERSGSSRDSILRATIWLADWADYNEVNKHWDTWLANVAKPTRATCGVVAAQPKHAVEVVITAARLSDQSE